MASHKLNQSLEMALRQMVDERARLDAAIRELQNFMGERDSRAPGRPAGKSKTSNAPSVAKKASSAAKRSRAWNPAARKAAADRMRKYWADQKKLKGKGKSKSKA